MEKTSEVEVLDIIELGQVTTETHGSVVGFDDSLGGLKIQAGLSDD